MGVTHSGVARRKNRESLTGRTASLLVMSDCMSRAHSTGLVGLSSPMHERHVQILGMHCAKATSADVPRVPGHSCRAPPSVSDRRRRTAPALDPGSTRHERRGGTKNGWSLKSASSRHESSHRVPRPCSLRAASGHGRVSGARDRAVLHYPMNLISPVQGRRTDGGILTPFGNSTCPASCDIKSATVGIIPSRALWARRTPDASFFFSPRGRVSQTCQTSDAGVGNARGASPCGLFPRAVVPLAATASIPLSAAPMLARLGPRLATSTFGPVVFPSWIAVILPGQSSSLAFPRAETALNEPYCRFDRGS